MPFDAIPMPAGRFNNSVSLESDTVTYVKGVEQRAAVAYATLVPANVMATRGRESWRGQQVRPEVDWIVTLRYRTDVMAKHRVVFGALKFEVLAVIPDLERRRVVTLECRSYTEAA